MMRARFRYLLLAIALATAVAFPRGQSPYEKNLEIRTSQIPHAGNGVYTKVAIPKGAYLGAYTGEFITEEEYLRRANANRWQNMMGLLDCAKPHTGGTTTIDGINGNVFTRMNYAPAGFQNVKFEKVCEAPFVKIIAFGVGLSLAYARGVVVGQETLNQRVKPPSNPAVGTSWTSPSDGREMVWIPPGEFLMGSPTSEARRGTDEAQHSAVIAHGFWMDATEVTNEAYRRFIQSNPAWQKGRPAGGLACDSYLQDWNGTDYPSTKGNHPVVWVSWHAAQSYCGSVGKRLPTEAEWEYAARAGTTTTYWWGAVMPPTVNGRPAANLADESAKRAHPDWEFTSTGYDDGYAGTAPVGSFVRNPWNLADILGNVWEWTSSLYQPYPYRSDDGRNSLSAGGARVARGGSWVATPRVLRSATRGRANPGDCSDLLGFRCVR